MNSVSKFLIPILVILFSSSFDIYDELPVSATPPQSSKQMKMEALLTSKKWICMEVSRKKLGKMDFSFEMGNEFRMTIDKKYNFMNNNFDFGSGTWKLDGKVLYFFYVDPNNSGKRLTTSYKIITLSESTLKIKRLDKPKGKLTFK